MWDDARRTTGSDDDLFRQAYLLTGDPERAERLARHALGAAAQHSRRTGPAGSDDAALGELVRAFVDEAGPGGHAGQPLPPGRHAAAWTALGGLPARRRAVLVLRYAERLSDRQIADRLGSTPRIVQADAEAGLLTLSPMLTGAGEPGRLVAAALADAGRRWADRPAPDRRTAGGRPLEPAGPALGAARRRRRRPRLVGDRRPAGGRIGGRRCGLRLDAAALAAARCVRPRQSAARRRPRAGRPGPRRPGLCGQDPAGRDSPTRTLPARTPPATILPATILPTRTLPARTWPTRTFPAGRPPAGTPLAKTTPAGSPPAAATTRASADPAATTRADADPAGGSRASGSSPASARPSSVRTTPTSRPSRPPPSRWTPRRPGTASAPRR